MLESSPAIPPERTRLFLAGALLFGVVLAAYWPALSGGFVFDDGPFLIQSDLIRSSAGLRRFWFSTLQTDYWPVTYTAFWAEWRLWGAHPLGYHAVNIALHGAEALMLWGILRRLRLPGAYLAAFLFAVHPVNVESVAWIIQLKNLMAMLFTLACVRCFLESGIPAAEPLRKGRWYALSLLCFALAMLSKGSVAPLPLVLLGIAAWKRRLSRRDALWSAPFFCAAAALAAVDVWFQKHGTGVAIRDAGLAERLAGAGAAVWFYLYKAVLPLNLVFVYPQWHIRAGNPLWWIPLLAALGFTALLYRRRAGPGRPQLFGWCYFCAALVPVMGFTDVYFMKFSLVADHYAHLALIGVVCLAGAGWARWDARSRRVAVVRGAPVTPARLAGGAVIVALAVLTWRQCGIYHDSRSLWSSVLAANPESIPAQNNLGNDLNAAGRPDEALAHYREALRIDPALPNAHNNIGMILAQMGRLPEAAAEFDEALRLNPHDPEALVNQGLVLKGEGRTGEAIADFQRALVLEPGNADAQSDLGIALVAEGRLPEAAAAFGEAVRLRPENADACGYLGAALADTGRADEAIRAYQSAIRLGSNQPSLLFNLGNLLAQAGRLPEAIDAFGRAVALKPDYAEAHANLGSALVNAGRLDEAVGELRKAEQLNPGYAQIHRNLAVILRALGREGEARGEEEAARRAGAGN